MAKDGDAQGEGKWEPAFIAIVPSPPFDLTKEPSTKTAEVTFFSSVGGSSETLKFSEPGMTVPANGSELVSGGRQEAYLWYSYDGQKVFWATPISGATPAPAAFTGSVRAYDGGKSETQQNTKSVPAPTDGSQLIESSGAIQLSTSAPGTAIETAANSNSTTEAASRSDSSDGSITSGAAAGIAVGCLIAGALIAGLVLWFCFGRRKRLGGRDSEASTVALMHREKGPGAKTLSMESGSPIAAAMENGLPQPLEDKAISGEVSKISNLIKNHVQSYYHTGRVSPGAIDYDDIQALGHNLPLSTGTLSTLLSNSATREIALRFCIAWVVVSRMRSSSDLHTTLLPPEVAKCFQSMSFVDRGPRAHAIFMAKWRAITAELLQSSYVKNPFSPSDARNYNIQAAALVLNNILQPYCDSRVNNDERKRNLEQMLRRAALFAFTLFSQPSSWDFDWQEEEGVRTGSLCIFPALVQTSDENGEPVNPPRPFSEAVVRRLSE